MAQLTDAQRRVAVAAAAGLSNRQVAELLGISERTVENHLRAAFRKLGVQRRQELKPHLGPRNGHGRNSATAEHLTRREGEVALLVGRAMSDKMVAETLRISVRTVESHVARVLDKLGFTSRGQIIGWTHSQPGAVVDPVPPDGIASRAPT
jgi:DNA-binding CsgD family transcriptional regulator